MFDLSKTVDQAKTGDFGINEKAMGAIIQEQSVLSDDALQNEVDNALAKT